MTESLFQFSDPRLVKLVFNINHDFDKTLYQGFCISNSVQKQVLLPGKEAEVNLSLAIGEETNSYPFSIHLEMSAKFNCDNSDLFDQLIGTNAPAMLLSYARPIISLITSQSGYPAFHLPFINFTDKKDG